MSTKPSVPNSLNEHWMPFSSNRDFKANPRLIVEAKGVYLKNHQGQTQIDASSGLFCNPLGHGREEIIDAITNQLKTLMTNSDITLIPSDSQDIFKAAASHNRVIDSIQGACIPIASPISSYRELSKLCYLTNDFGKAVDHVSKNFQAYALHSSLIREEMLKHFSPTSNKVKWIELISQLIQQTA